MAAGSIKIKIDGDDSGLQKELAEVERSAKSAAAALASEYKKAGMEQSDAMKKAWDEIKKAQSDGTKVVIDGVETIVKENEKIISQKDEMGDVYDELGDSAKEAARTVERASDQTGSSMQKMLKGVSVHTKAGLADIKAGIDMTVAAMRSLAGVVGQGVNYNAMMEGYKTSFEVMTGSAEKATEVVERLRKLGASTPFETTDLVKTTQLLMQYGFSADDAIDKMTMLGDISQGNAEAMTSIAMGYAQMSSAGKVNLQDIRQMINGGFNPLQEITERTGESMESLYDRISKGKMSVDEITESMRHATSEGGKFYQSMEKQSQTLNGQLSTLKDNASMLLGSITEGLSEDLAVNLLPLANNMIGELQTALEQGGIDGLMDAATSMIPDLLGLMTGKLQDAISGLSRWLPKGVSAIMSTLPSAIRGAGNVIPQLTTALFDTASLVVTDLIGMLPELVPSLLIGIADMGVAVAEGTLKIFTGVIEGATNAVRHMNQEFITDGIDPDVLKNFDFKIEMDLDSSSAVTEVQTAYGAVRDALNTDLLTEDQKKEILDMLGEDASAIKAKLMEFGLPETEAQTIADTISSSGQILADAFGDLDVGADGKTIAKWASDANGSNLMLRYYAKKAGLSDGDIDKIIETYDEINGRLEDETPSIMETIYDTLTDGKPDDDQTVEALTGKISTYISGLLTALEEEYKARRAALDPTAADYQQKVAELDAWYEASKTDIQGMDKEMRTLVSTLANAPTKTVQAKLNEFAELERRAYELEEKLGLVSESAKNAAQNAYRVVTAGGKADDATINMAVSLKFTEFKVDEQAAQEQYNAKIAELNEKFAKGDLTKREFDSAVLDAESERDAAIAAAQERFERAWAAMLKGIAESDGATFDEDMTLIGKADELVMQMINSIIENGEESITPEQKKAVSDMLLSIFPDLEHLFSEEAMEKYGWKDALQLADMTLLEELDTSVLSGKVQEVYAAALDQGILAGTSFDTTEKSDALAAMMGAIYTGASPEINAAAKAIGESAADSMADPAGSEAAGNETINGLLKSLKAGVKLVGQVGTQTGKSYSSAYKRALAIQSPSKVMAELGRYTGEGLEIGLTESMARAVDVANSIMGGLNTSADITRMTNVSMPELRQEITIASEQNKVPVNLDGHRIAEIQGQNNASQLAWMRARDARGYGQR